MNKQKGFTIIELIVVIAIIAVLAGIVLVNVTQYINKGKAAAIQGNLSTLLTNAAVYYDTPDNTYTGLAFCATATSIVTAVNGAGGTLTCYGAASTDTNPQAWCGVVPTMPSGGTYSSYCVDNTGYKGANVACSATHFTCQ